LRVPQLKGNEVKVLVATSLTQGQRENDYHHATDGELVWIQDPCATDRLREEPSCGCGRGFAGLQSHRATTTALVTEIDGLDFDGYIEALRKGLISGGWPGDWAGEEACMLQGFASQWPLGAVIERDLDEFDQRAVVGKTAR
jgi:hypothetical protein